MKACITGATGFVGAAVARALLDAGWEVRALTRARSEPRNLTGLALERVTGDLTDPPSLEAPLQDCDALFHVAADYRLGTRDPDVLYRTNVEGTRAILSAARRQGIRRVVYTSSVAAIGLPLDGAVGDESTPVRLEDMVGHYKRSKFLAEQVALEAARTGQDVVVVNPATPVGPGDVKPTPTGRMILDAAAGRTPAYVDTGLNIVHVGDVALGHLLAFARGRPGERYILGGENMSLEAILTAVTRLSGRPRPRVRLPHGVVLPIAYLAEAVARLTGGETRITVESVRMARKHMYFSSAKAMRELGFSARPPELAFREAIDWFRAHGYLSSS